MRTAHSQFTLMLRHFVKHSNKTHTRLIVDLLPVYGFVSYLMVEVYHAVLDNLLYQHMQLLYYICCVVFTS